MTTQPDVTLENPPGAEANSRAPEQEPRVYTAEDLLQTSQDDTHRYELIQGELIKMSPSRSEHGILAARILSRLQLHIDEHDLGLAFAAETGFRLARDPDTVRAPDASFVSKDRIPAEGVPTAFFPAAPDLVVEIVSPYDSASGVQDKVQTWLLHGSQLVWVVEPKTQTVTVYRADGSAHVLQRTDSLDGEAVLPGFRLELTRLFREKRDKVRRSN